MISPYQFVLIYCLAVTFGLPALAEEKIRRNVEVEWDSVEGAAQYEVQVFNKSEKAKKPMRFKTQTPNWSATIKPGFYEMQIRSFDDRGAPGDWSPPSELRVKLPSVVQTSPKNEAEITAHSEDLERVTFRWVSVTGAAKYRLAVRSSSTKWGVEKDVTDTQVDVEVPVGEQLNWNVTAIDGEGEVGDVNRSDMPFLMKGPKLSPPSIEKPVSKYVEEIRWASPNKAKTYTYELKFKNPQTKKWEKIDAQDAFAGNVLKLDIARPSGKYRLKVQAFADRRNPSKPVQLDFETHGGFRDPAALQREMLRDSINKPTNYYAIASYLVTQIQYQAINRDANTIPTFKALGGTGRIGLGYHDTDSQWGGFGIADVSGFTISGQNFKFASVEGHLTHKLEFGQGGLLLVGTGLFYKELPILSGSQTEGFIGVGKVSEIGPHFGFIYWIPLNQRFGLQANARAYYTVLGNSSAGQKAEAALSYQYGLLGSYRLNSTWMTYAGYALRHDEATYQTNSGSSTSFAKPNSGSNTISIQGNYINLLLEFSF